MMNDVLSLGYSPCPNDTFIFHALAHEFTPFPTKLDIFHADVEELNQRVLAGLPDISKVSASILPHILDEYVILRCGGALGRGCGPIVVCPESCELEKLDGSPLATPGLHTTAHLLLRLTGLHRGPYRPMRYDTIFPAVSSGEVAAGLVIHEGRFTYARYGLHQILDLGVWWEAATGLPLPLGAIVMRRSLGNELHLAAEKAIGASLRYAQRNPDASLDYIRENAQEMELEIISSHIRTFVNEFSEDLGMEGQAAIKALIKQALHLDGKPNDINGRLFPLD